MGAAAASDPGPVSVLWRLVWPPLKASPACGTREGSWRRAGDGAGLALVCVSGSLPVASPPSPVALKRVCVVTPAARRSGHGATGRRKGLHAPPLRAHEGRSLRAHGCVCVAAHVFVCARVCV